MPLDMSSVSRQILQMGESLQQREYAQTDRIAIALNTIHERSDAEMLAERVQAAKTPWWVPVPLGESLDLCTPAPPPPQSYTVIATDGSQIEPDRHSPALCFLLNVGSATIHYGENAKALLRNEAKLCFSDDDLFINSNNRQFLIKGQLLAVKRQVAELQKLYQLLSSLPADLPVGNVPVLGLQDGSLILWTLAASSIDEGVREMLLQEFLKYLDELRWARIPIASYISRPSSAEVVHALRVALCPYPTATCKQYCGQLELNRQAPCSAIHGVTDREVFAQTLAEGERSALFFSTSSISWERYLENRIVFFYLNAGREIGRVEIPEWVAADPQLLQFVHATIYEQCRRGSGYPPALIEAHEKAVIDAHDRQQFQTLLDHMLVRHGLSQKISAKSRAKHYHGA